MNKGTIVIIVGALCMMAALLISSNAQGDFDRDGCLRSCDWLKPRVGAGSWAAYSNCVAECERAFWDEFNRKEKDLERERDKD